ncbi:hypothetical protein A8H35_22580 [Burkholderia thailandensis]|nr:hypothetical protein WJ27_28215 [Burkholderia thailandensis]AWY61053.1 hypothetical protein A8H35_22580 [Burkholderia thailandensis]
MRGEETAGTGGSAIEIDTPRRPSRSTDAGPVGRRAAGGTSNAACVRCADNARSRHAARPPAEAAKDKRPGSCERGPLEGSRRATRGGAHHTRSIAIAMPCPTPMHIVQSAKRPPVRCN